MNRKHFLLGLSTGIWARGAHAQQLFSRSRPRLQSQNFNAVILSGNDYRSLFLPSLGATRVSAIVTSEIRGTAFFDMTNNELGEQDIVYGVTEQILIPGRAIIMAVPAELLVFARVRLRMINEDRFFGRVRGTVSVYSG
ncbi:hypothetical protein [Anthocerotibacter panamensis]|uniref:hypothetical protein n=1 Tax=Anthocerotibacter panamensis TaxID=2857077 RepID=UPI001C4024EF|nr:hypothetical protein [Anthocerotibacter panamensis]